MIAVSRGTVYLPKVRYFCLGSSHQTRPRPSVSEASKQRKGKCHQGINNTKQEATTPFHAARLAQGANVAMAQSPEVAIVAIQPAPSSAPRYSCTVPACSAGRDMHRLRLPRRTGPDRRFCFVMRSGQATSGEAQTLIYCSSV